MQIQKKYQFNSYHDVKSKIINNYFNSILNNFEPTNKKILLFVQCSKQKPYSESLSHGYIRRAIKQITGFDPYKYPEQNPIQIVVISSLIGPVPSQFESDPIPTNYNLSVNRISKEEFKIIKPVLINRLLKFLSKFEENYENIVFFVKNNYRKLCEELTEESRSKYLIIPEKDLHMIREAWIELKLVLLNLLKEKIILQPIPRKILLSLPKKTNMLYGEFSLKDFKKIFGLSKTDKQVNNYLLTFRKLKIIKKINHHFKLSKNFLRYIDINKKSEKSAYSNIEILRDYIFKYASIKYNLRYILFQIYKEPNISVRRFTHLLNINQFSIRIYIQLLKWLNLIQRKNKSFVLKRSSRIYLNKNKYLDLIDENIRITNFSE